MDLGRLLRALSSGHHGGLSGQDRVHQAIDNRFKSYLFAAILASLVVEYTFFVVYDVLCSTSTVSVNSFQAKHTQLGST